VRAAQWTSLRNDPKALLDLTTRVKLNEGDWAVVPPGHLVVPVVTPADKQDTGVFVMCPVMNAACMKALSPTVQKWVFSSMHAHLHKNAKAAPWSKLIPAWTKCVEPIWPEALVIKPPPPPPAAPIKREPVEVPAQGAQVVPGGMGTELPPEAEAELVAALGSE
jgi:hypothetical protein